MTGVPDGPPSPVTPPAGQDPRDLARMFDDAARRHDLAHDLLAGGQSFRWRRLVREAVAAPPGALVLDICAGTGTSSVPFARSGVRTVAADFSLGMLAEGFRQYRKYGTVPDETRRANPTTRPARALRRFAHRAADVFGEFDPWERPYRDAAGDDAADGDDVEDVDDVEETAPGPADGSVVGTRYDDPAPTRPKGKRRNLAFVAADATALPFGDGVFDAVTMSFGLRNVPDPPAALREFARVTRPGGRIVVCEFSRPTNRAARAAYGAYARVVLPRIAERISSSPQAYEHLLETMLAWPAQRDFARMLRAGGWERVEWRNLSGGVVALHRATRAGGPAGAPPTGRPPGRSLGRPPRSPAR